MSYTLNKETLHRKLQNAGLEDLAGVLIEDQFPDPIRIKTDSLNADRFLLYSLRKVYGLQWVVKIVDGETLEVSPGHRRERQWTLGPGTKSDGSSLLTEEEKAALMAAIREVKENGI